MERFVVRKNTLPYVHQWAVMDTKTGNKIAEYKTRKLAEKACDGFRRHGLPYDTQCTPPSIETPLEAIRKRMRRPNGDPPPKKRSHDTLISDEWS